MLQTYRLCNEYVILLGNSGYMNAPNYIYMYIATLVNEYEDTYFSSDCTSMLQLLDCVIINSA